jgi:hypothetical protein
VIAAELGISTLERGVPSCLGLLDTVTVRLALLVVLRGIL